MAKATFPKRQQELAIVTPYDLGQHRAIIDEVVRMLFAHEAVPPLPAAIVQEMESAAAIIDQYVVDELFLNDFTRLPEVNMTVDLKGVYFPHSTGRDPAIGLHPFLYVDEAPRPGRSSQKDSRALQGCRL